MKKLWDRFNKLYDTEPWVKQLADQSLHLFGGIIVVNIIAMAVPNIWGAAFIVLIAWGFWEALQRPSSRPWDPVVDWTVQVLGAILGVLLH